MMCYKRAIKGEETPQNLQTPAALPPVKKYQGSTGNFLFGLLSLQNTLLKKQRGFLTLCDPEGKDGG